jgi:RNA polymerase sigma-70 factor (ECF subfamily)
MNAGRHVLTEPGCFASIFDRHAGEILRYAHARLGPELAEDVTAETFLAAFRHRDRYDTTRPDARPWLYGIAVRQIGRHRRAQGRQLRLLVAWAGLSYEESARALGLTVSAVKSRLHRIRIRTRQALGGANAALEAEETGHGRDHDVRRAAPAGARQRWRAHRGSPPAAGRGVRHCAPADPPPAWPAAVLTGVTP